MKTESTELENTVWTERRVHELSQLVELIHDSRSIDSGNQIIERLKRMEKIGADLVSMDLDTGRTSFAQFLRELAVRDRSTRASLAVLAEIERLGLTPDEVAQSERDYREAAEPAT